MNGSFINYLDQNREMVYEEIKRHLKLLSIPSQLKESMLYSFKAGGKKVRPLLLIASNQAYKQNTQKVLSAAVALEMIHTYSLIHDDLPAMDDDDFRRGKPTNHKVFDEATAILAGDALLTYSFEVITNDITLTNEQKVKLIQMLAKMSGPSGMVAGQILDMEAESRSVKLSELEKIHTLKTGQLLSFAVIAGAYLGGAKKEELDHLETFSYYLGLIFQVQDDILDVIGDQDKLGKPVGSDEGNQKSTYPKLLGLEGAKAKKKEYVIKARGALSLANADDSYLAELLDYITKRDH